MGIAEPLQDTRIWHFWRGTPELLAHVARVAQRVCEAPDTPTPRCTIDVEVDGDHEIFDSPSEFVSNVTQSALRKFWRIEVRVDGAVLSSTFRMEWTRPWWKPDIPKDADVVLTVTAPDPETARSALETIERAVSRGGSRASTETWQSVVGLLVAGAVAAAFVTSAGFGLYLLTVPLDELVLQLALLGVVGFVGGFVVGTWAYPSIEVAPGGQSNLQRLLKAVTPVMVSLVLAGLGKALYG
jgi:hypothetical protein